MTMISKVDDKSSLNGLNRNPSVAIISCSLKTTNQVLKQKGDGARVSVTLHSECELRLRAFRVEIDHNLLVHIHTRLPHCFFIQSHSLRQHLQQLACQSHEVVAVLLRHLSPPFWLLRPPRIVPAFHWL